MRCSAYSRRDRALNELWPTAPRATGRFDPACVDDLPEGPRRYLLHALAPGVRLSQAARMHGETRLGDDRHRFEAEQVLRQNRGFVWLAHVRKGLTPIVGSERRLDGEWAMRWRLLGVVPLIEADGPDISRSAAVRLHIESTWVPAVFLGPGVRWAERAAAHARAPPRPRR